MDIARAALVACVPVVATHSLPAVYALSFLMATAGVLFDPARLAILPEIVPPKRLLRANSLLSTGENLTEILGWASAGLLLASLSTTVAFQLDAVTFGVSAVALGLMRYREPDHGTRGHTARSFGRELREGFGLLLSDRRLRENTVMIVVCTAGLGAVYPLTFFFALHVLDGGAGTFSALEAVVGAGFFIGSLALVALAPQVHKGRAMIGGLAVMGACIAVFAVSWSVWSAAVPLAIFGIANAVVLIAVDTYLQEIVPHSIRGRVLAMRFTITKGMYAFSDAPGGRPGGRLTGPRPPHRRRGGPQPLVAHRPDPPNSTRLLRGEETRPVRPRPDDHTGRRRG